MNHFFQASLCIGLVSLAYPAQGQITPDGSLSTKVGQQGNVSEITGGEQAGANLFHSFQDFSVPTGNEAFFNNGLDIDNILSRVTGGNISDIDGLIRANGTANLFLINPAGIVFGDNATLQLGGSFFGSTATGITFADGTVFSSSDSGQPSLTINAPIGLDLRNTTGNISSRANLQSDRSLTLSANNLEVRGQIEAAGNLTLEALNNLSLGDLISLNNAVILSQGDVSLGNYEGASLQIQSGGNVTVNGDISIAGTSIAEDSLPKTITLANGEPVEINNGTKPTVDIRAGINNADASLDNSLQSGSNIRIDGRINNPGGNVLLTNQFEPNATLAAGNVTVAEINTSNSLGNGGDVIVDSRNDINIPDGINTSSVVDAQLTTEANLETFPQVNITSGNAGAIALLANKIIVGDLTASSLVNLDLNTEVDTIEEANNIFAIPQARVTAGAGGTVNLQAQNQINLGKLDSSSAIAINSESIALDNFSIIAALLELTTANGGEIRLDAGTNLTTGDLSSRVAISDRLNSSASTTPDITLSVSQVALNISQAEIGSGGAILLQAGSQINTGELDSSVSVMNIADNQALVFADNSLATTAANPARAISQIDLNYENINLGSAGEINLASDRATVGNVNSSLSVTSENTVFAAANAENDAVTESLAISDNNLEVTGDRPGNITFDVSERVNFNLLNAAAITNDGVNNLDSVAFSNSEQAIATANADGTNIISFNQTNSGLISFGFIVPDVDLAVEPLQDFTPSFAQPMAFNLCSVNVSAAEIPAIETAKGKLYAATKAVVEDDKVRLIATSKHQEQTINLNLMKSCQ